MKFASDISKDSTMCLIDLRTMFLCLLSWFFFHPHNNQFWFTCPVEKTLPDWTFKTKGTRRKGAIRSLYILWWRHPTCERHVSVFDYRTASATVVGVKTRDSGLMERMSKWGHSGPGPTWGHDTQVLKRCTQLSKILNWNPSESRVAALSGRRHTLHATYCL